MEHDAFRSQVLQTCGASPDVAGELLAYNENPFTSASRLPPAFPLPDEPHIESWLAYEADAREAGAFEALRRRFVQLRFPIQAGISTEDAYRAATLRGLFAEADRFSPGVILRRPSALDLVVHPTMAGRVPVLVVEDREDFVALVQAFSERNEPAPVPDAMGACIVTGLNNWDRIASYRAAWALAQGDAASAEAWAEEFQRLVPRKERYQDRFIMLSRGPYSATSAREAGLDEPEWLARSIVIRREHEFTHYFTYRVFGVMRNNILDELVADFVGLVRAFGRYPADLALRVLGLESFPRYRPGGRLECYRGRPALSDEAFDVLGRLTFQAVQNLERLAATDRDLLQDLGGLARVTFALVGLTLEELASSEMLLRAAARLG